MRCLLIRSLQSGIHFKACVYVAYALLLDPIAFTFSCTRGGRTVHRDSRVAERCSHDCDIHESERDCRSSHLFFIGSGGDRLSNPWVIETTSAFLFSSFSQYCNLAVRSRLSSLRLEKRRSDSGLSERIRSVHATAVSVIRLDY
jgi:hypothetical protein